MNELLEPVDPMPPASEEGLPVPADLRALAAIHGYDLADLMDADLMDAEADAEAGAQA